MKKILWAIFSSVLVIGFNPHNFAKTNPFSKSLIKQIKNIDVSYISNKKAIHHLRNYIKSKDNEIMKGLRMVLLPDENLKENYALKLLLYLLSKKAYQKNDSITIAMALANNYLYSIASKSAKKAIRKDMRKHFNYYLTVLKWQKTLRIQYNLRQVPLIPKIYWAYRVRAMDRVKYRKKLTLKHYYEFVDKIENLEKMHDIIKNLNLRQYESLLNLAQNLEGFARGHNLAYRCKIDCIKKRFKKKPDDKNLIEAIKEYKNGGYETYYFGKVRKWDQFAWLNYQINRFLTKGKFKGDCYTITTIQTNLYKAAGIPALSNQIYSIKPHFYHHNSPYFYNPFFKRWNSVQKPREHENGYYNYFSIPRWHHYLVNKYKKSYKKYSRIKIKHSFWKGETASYSQVVNLRKKGFMDHHFEKFFLTFKTLQKGIIYNEKSAPPILADKDGDGILDVFEFYYKTNLQKADSDGDGVSDLYEIEQGTHPLHQQSKPNGKIHLDGLAKKERQKLKLMLRYSPAGDADANDQVYDVKSIAAKKIKNYIYIAVSFHNNISGNTRDTHSLRITTSPSGKNYFVQYQGGRAILYEKVKKENKNILKKKIYLNWPIVQLKDVEFKLPVKFFKKTEALIINYQATGIKDGKVSNHADYSNQVRVALKENSLEDCIQKINWQKEINDPQGDAKGEEYIYDLKKIKVAFVDNKLYVLAQFYENITSLPLVAQTIDIRNNKSRYFFQTWRLNVLNLYMNKKKNKLSLDQFKILTGQNKILYVINVTNMPEGHYKMHYRAGAKKANGKNEINSDISERIEIIKG